MMVTIDGYEVPDDYYYTDQHTYANIQGELAIVGVTTVGIDIAGKISFIRAKKRGTIKQMKTFGTMEAGKGVLRLPAPLSGEIVELNPLIAKRKLTMVNQDPYGEGWIIKIKYSDKSELENLIGGEKIEPWIKEEVTKVSK